MNIKNNILQFRQSLPEGCRLIAVSKTQPAEVVREAYKAGQRDFGENKVQEMVDKSEALPKDIQWHLIGHLQTNKVKYIAPFVHLIHSVDSLKLLKEIQKQAAKANRTISCLLQVHIASEETKFGLNEEELMQLIQSPELPLMVNVQVVGLMGMATFTENESVIEKEFSHLNTLAKTLRGMTLPSNVKISELSIGMSGDHKLAIRNGSTMVRVGTAIFGERNTKL